MPESHVFRRQILTSKDDAALKGFNMYNDRGPLTGIQMKQKELTKIFMMISNRKIIWSP